MNESKNSLDKLLASLNLKVHQSPVDIQLSGATKVLTEGPVQIDFLFNLPTSIRVSNEGHTVKFILNYEDGRRPIIHGGTLADETYVLDHFHFHWGRRNAYGSEHLLNGQSFPLEMHVVWYNKIFGNMNNAQSKVGGLSVAAFFFELCYNTCPHHNLSFLTKPLRRISRQGSEIELTHGELFSLGQIIGSNPWHFASYQGSLTTPPFYESVTWLVSLTPLKVRFDELQDFRSLRKEDGTMLADNFRSVQKLNNRRILLLPD